MKVLGWFMQLDSKIQTPQIDVNSKRYYYGLQLYTTLIGGDYNDCDTWPFSVRLFADKVE